MLTTQQIASLLGDLCRKLGFCLPPDAQRAVHEATPDDPHTFAEAVFRAEGIERWPSNRQLFRQVVAECEHAFAVAARADT